MKVVIMAGGRGTRISELFPDIPKPLIPIDGIPVLEREVCSLASQGFRDIILTVSYLHEKIEEHFGDGSKWGVKIEYFVENTPLGNAGALFKLNLKEDFLLLGAKENPYPYYKQCDLYVHATRFEGKSIAIQEAQVLGCTILVSDCSGNREQVENGTDGILCQLSPEDISRKISELLGNEEKCREYGKKATVRISDEQGDILKLFEIV